LIVAGVAVARLAVFILVVAVFFVFLDQFEGAAKVLLAGGGVG
jgi:hypothetical protein